jgi:hypothetical protein
MLACMSMGCADPNHKDAASRRSQGLRNHHHHHHQSFPRHCRGPAHLPGAPGAPRGSGTTTTTTTTSLPIVVTVLHSRSTRALDREAQHPRCWGGAARQEGLPGRQAVSAGARQPSVQHSGSFAQENKRIGRIDPHTDGVKCRYCPGNKKAKLVRV